MKFFFVKEDSQIAGVDDYSPSKLDENLKKVMSNVRVLRIGKRRSGRSGLNVTQAILQICIRGFRF